MAGIISAPLLRASVVLPLLPSAFKPLRAIVPLIWLVYWLISRYALSNALEAYVTGTVPLGVKLVEPIGGNGAACILSRGVLGMS